MDFLKYVPKWLLAAAAFFLMGLLAYSVHRGAAIKFWPPEIIPSSTALDSKRAVNLSTSNVTSLIGELSEKEKDRVHLLSMDAGTVIVIQPRDTTSASLYFDMTLQAPSGKMTTVGRFKSTDDSVPFPYTATEAGVYFLVVSKRDDGGNSSDGPYRLVVTVE